MMANPTHLPAKPMATAGTLADRVTEVLLQKINSGEFPLNSLLPSELVMAERLSS